MTDKHPLTDEMCYQMTLENWDEGCTYHDMRAAYDKGAEDNLKQMEEWLYDNLGDILLVNGFTSPLKNRYALARDVIRKLGKAMRPQENTND